MNLSDESCLLPVSRQPVLRSETSTRGTRSRKRGMLRAAGCFIAITIAVGQVAGATDENDGGTSNEPPPPPLNAEINFGGRTFNSVLPFDQYYAIYGSAPANTEEIKAFRLERPQRFRVRRTAAGEFECFDLRKDSRNKAVRFTETKTTCEWIDLGIAERGCVKPGPPVSNPPANVPFCYVQQEPLEADRHYLFRFDTRTTLTETQRDEIEVEAAKSIHDIIGAQSSGDIDEAQMEQLHTSIRQSLKELAGRQKVELDGVFATAYQQLPEARKTAFKNEIAENFDEVLDVQDGLADRAEHTVLLQQNLLALQQMANQPDQPLAKLIAALKARAQDNPPIADWLQTHADALQLLELNNQQTQNLLAGASVDSTTPLPDLVNKPETLDEPLLVTMAANYDLARNQLERLADLLEKTLRPTVFDDLVESDQGNPEALTAGDRDLLQKTVQQVSEVSEDAFTLKGDADFLARAFTERQVRNTALAKRVRVLAVRDSRLVSATTQGDYRTRQNWYLSLDLGLAATPEIDEVLRFAAVNIYLRPVNRQASFREANSFLRRFAFTLGITEGGVTDDSVPSGGSVIGDGKTREDLFGSSSLLVGAGYRVTEALRLGIGAVVFKEKDTNPLIDNDSLTYTPYVSLSFDWDINNAVFRRLIPRNDG